MIVTVKGKDGRYYVNSTTEILDRFFLTFQQGNSTYLVTHYDYVIKQKTVLEILRDRKDAVEQSHLEAILKARKRAARKKTVIDQSDLANNF